MDIDEIRENFSYLDDWDDRYRYLIELGRTLEPLTDGERTAANKVLGCASQVWLVTETAGAPNQPVLHFRGDSDAHIVRGLVALVLALYSDKSAAAVAETQAQPLFEELGLATHLTPQRSNGLRAMVDRIKTEARTAHPHAV